MAYATQDDMVPRRMSQQDLEQLTSDDPSSGVDDQLVADILTEASGTVDSYCRQRYAVPLQASEQIKGITLDIAVYLLYSRRPRGATDSVTQRYKDAVQFLRDVSSGTASLDQASGASPQTSGGAPVVSDTPEVFSDDNLEGFV